MNTKKVIAIIAAVTAVLGLFMPIVSAGQFFVNIHHIGGLYFALYLIVPAMLILAILRQYKPFAGDRGWLCGTAGLTLILTIMAKTAAGAIITQFATMSNSFSNMFGGGESAATTPALPEVAVGFGTIMIIAGAMVCVVTTLVDGADKKAA